MSNVVSISNNISRTMTSREIADLTGKEHKNVLTDIRKMLEDLSLTSAVFSADLFDTYGRVQPGFKLPKRESLILVSGYSVAMRAKIIDRWQELELTAANLPEPLRLVSSIEMKLSEQLGIARLFDIPMHLAQVEAVKNINSEMGVNLNQWLKLAPAQDNLLLDDRFLEPTDIGKMFGVKAQYINAGLINAGLQVKSGAGYKSTDLSSKHSSVHQWKQGSKTGYNLKWRVSFVKEHLGLQEAA